MEKLLESYDVKIGEAAIYLIFVALILWLYKEFKTQHLKEKEERSKKIENSLIALNNIIIEEYQYKKGVKKDKNDVFIAIRSSFSDIDYYLYRSICKIFDNSALDDDQKIDHICKEIHAEVDTLNIQNKNIIYFNRLTDQLDKFLIKIKDIVTPIINTIITVIITSIFVGILLTEDIGFVKGVKVFTISVLVYLIPMVIDMYQIKKLKPISYIIIPFIFITLIINLFFSSVKVISISLFIFFVAFILLLIIGIRKSNRLN